MSNELILNNGKYFIISDKIKEFNYNDLDLHIDKIYDELKCIFPQLKFKIMLNNGMIFNILDIYNFFTEYICINEIQYFYNKKYSKKTFLDKVKKYSENNAQLKIENYNIWYITETIKKYFSDLNIKYNSFDNYSYRKYITFRLNEYSDFFVECDINKLECRIFYKPLNNIKLSNNDFNELILQKNELIYIVDNLNQYIKKSQLIEYFTYID